MELEWEAMDVPEQAELRIEFSMTAKVNVTSVMAQRKVSRLLLENVGNQLYGERPTLVTGSRLLWRVPIWLGLPSSGPVAKIGDLDVDAQSGEILYSQPLLDEIGERAGAVARRAASGAS